MKKLLTSLLTTILFLFSVPTSIAQGPNDTPFLAVFCNPGFEYAWCNLQPELLMTAFSWSQFDRFLYSTKASAKDRPIEIDICCHGGENVCIEYDNVAGQRVRSEASAGYVMNHIQTVFPDSSKIIVVMEMCHGGYVWHNTIKGSKAQYNESLHKDPEFIVLGGSSRKINYLNFVYLQYKTQIFYDIVDLRKYTEGEVITLDDQSDKEVKRLNLKRYDAWVLLNKHYIRY